MARTTTEAVALHGRRTISGEIRMAAPLHFR